MKKQKFNSITFHEAAAKIVDQYFGEIPDFILATRNKIETNKGIITQWFSIHYEHEFYSFCNTRFYCFEETPVCALKDFEKQIMAILHIPIPEEIPELIDFDLPY